MNILMIVILILLYIRYFQICGRQRKPVKAMLVNSIAGIAALFILSFILSFWGKAVLLNYAATAAAAVLGLPGVMLMLLLWILF